MARKLLSLMTLLLAACSQKGAQADLPAISQARSLAAEWAMTNDEASRGQLTSTFAETMREAVHEQLQTASSSLKRPDSPYGEQIRALLTLPADTSAEQLRARASALKQIENQLESD